MGEDFCGAYTWPKNGDPRQRQVEATPVNGPQRRGRRHCLPENERETFIEELELARGGLPPFDRQSFLKAT
jgi:peptide chain release factor 3